MKFHENQKSGSQAPDSEYPTLYIEECDPGSGLRSGHTDTEVRTQRTTGRIYEADAHSFA